MARPHERVSSHLDTLRRIERDQEDVEQAPTATVSERAAAEEELLRSARRDSYMQELARKAAIAEAEAHEVSQRDAEHRVKLDSLRVTTEQQARDVEQARLYEHDAEMKQLQAQEKKKVGWAPSLLAILALAGLGAGAWFGIFQPMAQQARHDTALERQRVVDESVRKQEAQREKEEAERRVAQEQERLRRTKTAITAAAAATDEDAQRTTAARRRTTRATGATAAEAPAAPARDRGPVLPDEDDPLLGL